MPKTPVLNTPAHEQEPSTPTANPPRAGESALVQPQRESAVGTSHEGQSDGAIINEDDLVDPSGLIAEVAQRLFRLREELEQAGGADLAPAAAIALIPQLSELLAMRAALRVGMDIEEWMSILFRTAEISWEVGSVREELAEYLDRRGFARTDRPDAEPTEQ